MIEITQTLRGAAVARFNDVAGSRCSMQDSSVANEACVWFGVDKDEHGEDGERMHLTARMATRLAHLMRDHAEGRTDRPYAPFTDRNGSECTFDVTGEGDALVGVTSTIGQGPVVSLMILDKATCAQMLEPLLAFIGGGSINSGKTHDIDAVPPEPTLDVKIPKSMLERADVGETGVSVARLLEAFLGLVDGEDLDSLRSTLGHDRGEDVNAVYASLRHLRAG
jgi:hypothetical protein